MSEGKEKAADKDPQKSTTLGLGILAGVIAAFLYFFMGVEPVAAIVLAGILFAILFAVSASMRPTPPKEEKSSPADTPLSESVPRLEMEIDELQDLRRPVERRASKGNAGGCGWLMVIGGGLLLLFIEPFTGGLTLVAGILVLAFFSGGGNAKKELAEIDGEIKRRREKIVKLKEAEPK